MMRATPIPRRLIDGHTLTGHDCRQPLRSLFVALGLVFASGSHAAVPSFDYGALNATPYQLTQDENLTAIISAGDVLNTDGTGIDDVKINGGNDSSRFTLTYVDDATTFDLAFTAAPDYDAPSDSDADNTYEVILKATDKDGETATVTYTVVIQDVNESPSFTSSSTISRLEKTTSNPDDTSALTVTATDPENATLTYSITGGNDQARFSIGSSTGVLTFASAPDYDSALDSDTNNVYSVTVRVSDGTNNTDQSIDITIVNVEEAPTITQPSTTGFSVQENWSSAITTLDFSDPDFEVITDANVSYLLSGEDQGVFNLDQTTGELTFLTAPSYEAPADADLNNTYEVTVTIRDAASETDSVNLSITVIDVNDAPTISIDTTSANVTDTAGSITVDGYETRANGTSGFDFSSLNNNKITIDDDDYSGSGLPQLLLWLQLDETSGTVATDSSGNGFSADLLTKTGEVSGAKWVSGTDSVNAREYNALQFSGVDYLRILDAAAAALKPEDSSYSISFWYQIDTLSTAMLMYSKGNTFTSATTEGISGFVRGEGYVVSRVADGTNVAEAYKTGVDTDWHHFATVLNRSQKLLTTYVDGVAYVQQTNLLGTVSDLNTMATIDTTANFLIGTDDGTTGRFFEGSLDDFRIYDGALTESQINELRGGGDPGQMQVTLQAGQGTLTLGDDISGITLTTGDGTDDTTIIFQATYSAATTALDGLVYSPNTAFNGTDTLAIVVNDQDNLNVGGAMETTVLWTLNVQAINTTPINTIPGGQSLIEGGSLSFNAASGNGISITDDAEENTGGSSDIQVTLTALSGTGVITLVTKTGLAFTVGDGDDDATMVFTGSPTNINTALDTLSFNLAAANGGDEDFNGAATIIIETNDKANYGLDDLTNPDPGQSATEYTDTDTISITVIPVNDSPVLTLTDTSITENSTFVAQATVADPDLNDTNSTETHSYSIFGGADQAFFEIDGNGNLSFKAAPSFESAQDDDSLNTYQVTVRVTDGGGLTGDQAITVTVTDGNDTPTFTTTTTTYSVEENQTSIAIIAASDEDTAETLTYSVSGGVDQALFQIDGATGVLTFSAAPDFENSGSAVGGNDYFVEITATDNNGSPLATASPLALTVTVTDVNDAPSIDNTAAISMTENQTAVATITATDADAGDSVQFSISGGDSALFTIDAATGVLAFASAPSFENALDADTGNDYVVDVTATDSASATGTTTFTITVTDINDAPQVTLASTDLSANENQTAVTSVTVSDDDTGDTLSFALANSDDGALFSLVATSTDPATGAATLTFITAPDFEGPSDLNGDNVYNVIIQIGDGTETTLQPMTVTVVNQNDPPAFSSFPTAQTVDEDTNKTFDSANGNQIQVQDPDVSDTGVTEADKLEVTLQVVSQNGTLTLGTHDADLISGGSDGSSSVSLKGNPQSINTALSGLNFKGTEHYNGLETVSLTINDLGNTDGAAETTTATIDFTINAINDEPANSIPLTTQTTSEDIPLVLSQANVNQISVSDPDSTDNSQSLTVTLSMAETNGIPDGTLTLNSTAGLTFDTTLGGGDGSSAASLLTFTGTITNINTALNGLTFAPAAEFNGATKFTIISSDTSSSDTDEVNITVNPVNDAPTITVPGAQTVNEDETLTFVSVTNIAQVDTLTITGGGTGDVYTLTLGGNDLDFSFNTNVAQTATDLVTGFNANGALTALATASDQGGGVVKLTALTAGTPITSSVAVKTNTSGLAVASLATTTDNVTDTTLSISDDASDNSSEVELQISVTRGVLVLSGTTGLVFDETQGGGQAIAATTGNAAYVITGTVTNINAALQGLTYTPNAGVNGSETLTVSVADQGNYGTGDSNTVQQTLAITISPVNDGPSVTAPTVTQQANEDETLTFNTANGNLISVSDPDASEVSGSLQVTLSALFGNITLSGMNGLTFTTGTGPTDSTLIFTGQETDINNALNGLIYTPNADHNDDIGSEVITVQVDDQGNNGGSSLSATATISVSLASLNDAPTITLDNSNPSTDEKTELTLNSANGNAITIADDASDTDAVIQVTFNPDYNQVNTITITGGGTGDTYNVTVDGNTMASAVNFNTDAATTAGDLATAIAADATISAIVTAADAGGGVVTLTAVTKGTAFTASSTATDNGGGAATLDATTTPASTKSNGTLTLSSENGITFNGLNGSTGFAFAGTLANVLTAIDGLKYLPGVNADGFGFNGDDKITILVQDLGKSGTGGFMETTETLTITVNPVNEAPIHLFNGSATPASQTTEEDVPLVFSSENSNAITFTDDASEDDTELQVTLLTGPGTLTLASLTGLNFTTGDGTDDGTMIFTGKIASINTALEGLSFNPDADNSTDVSISITTSDQGNTGSGGALSDIDFVSITVDPVNDGPSVTYANSTPSTSEDSTLTFNADTNTLITISDDASEDESQVSVQLSVSAGTLTLGLTADGLATNNVNVVGGTNGTSTVTISGTVEKVNLAINGLQYAPPSDYSGSATLTLLVDDQGNYGSGDSQQVTSSATITINAVNDAPVLTKPGDQFTNEDTSLTLSSDNGNALSVSDPDTYSNSTAIQVTLALVDAADALVTDLGDLTLVTTENLVFTDGTDGTNETSTTFRGTLSDVNTALSNLVYTPPANYNGDVYIKVSIDDQGNVGTGVAMTNDSSDGNDEVKISLIAINDGPTLAVESKAQETNEDTPITFTAGTQVQVDTVTITAGDLAEAVAAVAQVDTITITAGDISAAGGATYSATIDAATFTVTEAVEINNGDNAAAIATALSTVINATYAGMADASAGDGTLTLTALTPGTMFTTSVGTTDTGLAAITSNTTTSNVSTVSAATYTVTIDTTAHTVTVGSEITNSDSNVVIATALATLVNAGATGVVADASAADGTFTLTGPDALTVFASVAVTTDTGAGNISVTTTTEAQAANGISVSDVDVSENNDLLLMTLSVTNGLLTLNAASDPSNNFTFTLGDGTDDSAMIFTGTPTNINTALSGLVFTPNQDYNETDGSSTLSIITSDQGSTGVGGTLTGSEAIIITVKAQNDVPVITMDAAYTTQEDTAFTLSSNDGKAISLADVDTHESENSLEVSLTVTSGTIHLPNKTGLGFTVGDGQEEATMTFSGSPANINTSLDGLIYNPTADFNGTDTLTVTVNDGGSQGDGGALQATSTMTITVEAVNDGPSITFPGTQIVDEDTPITFSGDLLISTLDVDATETAPGKVTLTLAVSNGILTMATLQDLTVDAGANSSATMTLTGTTVDLNTALDGMVYTPAQDYNGDDLLTLSLTDLGLTGSGGELVDTGQVILTLTSINDDPVLTLPAGPTIDEDTTQTFSTGAGTLVAIADVDVADSEMTLNLSVNDGILTLATAENLTISSGANESSAMTLVGTLTNLNTALDGVVFTPDTNFNGTATLAVSVNDGGASGNGGGGDVSSSLDITVSAVNDAPVITLSADPEINEDNTLSFSAATEAKSQVDTITGLAGDNTVDSIQITIDGGTDLVANWNTDAATTGADIVSLVNAADAGVTAALSGSDVTITANTPGTAFSLSVSVTDTSGNGTIAASSSTTTENVAATQSNLITITDDATEVDAEIELSLTVTAGTLTLAGTDGLTVSAGADQSSTMTLNGTASALTTAMDGMVYSPDTNSNTYTLGAAATLSLAANDQGGTGSGGAQTASKDLLITINPINDAPVLSVPTTATTDEDTQLIFNSANSNLISFTDDASENASDVELQLTVTNGTLTLASEAGVVISGGANETTTVTLSGNVLNLNTAIDGLAFNPDQHFNGVAQLLVHVNDNNNAGDGIAQTATTTIDITVTAQNDAPAITFPGAQAIDEDTTLTFSAANSTAISVADDDVAEGSGSLQIILTANYGTLALASTENISITDGADASAAITFVGTPQNINTALDGLVYSPNLDVNDDDTITITLSDLGDTGAGGELTASQTIALTINSINDAPVNSLPNAQSVREDETLTLSTANTNLISISDDSPETSTALEIQLTVTQGILTLPGTVGLSVTAGADASSSITVSGQLADINTGLDGLVYTPTAEYFGADTLTIITVDNGGSGSGGTLLDTDVLNITVQAVNDSPVNTLPLTQNLNEDSSLTFNAANENAVSIYDDASISSLAITTSLEVTNGIITLSTEGLNNLELVAGSLNSSASVHVTGFMDDINLALNDMVFTPSSNFIGDATITVTTDDHGAKDDFDSGSLTDSDTITITVSPVNDVPVLTYPTALLNSFEDAPVTFSESSGYSISVNDPDSYGTLSAMKLTLSVDQGILTLSGTTGLTIFSGSDASANMVLLGTPDNLNQALAGMIFTPTTDYIGEVNISISVDDQGNTGTGSDLTADGAVQLYLGPSNDAPVITVPVGSSLNEDSSLVLSGDLVQVDDDAGGTDTIKVTVTATDGLVSLSDSSGVLVSLDGSSGALEFQGTLTQVNTALNSLTFTPTPDFAGDATISISVDDQGGTGEGGAMTGTQDLTLTVAAVNDAPTIAVPSGQLVGRGGSITFSSGNGNAITFADLDAGTDDVIQVSLVTSQGTLTLPTTSGATLVTGDGTADATIIFTATFTNALTILDGLTFSPTLSDSTQAQVQVSVDDQGNTGSGGAESASATLNLEIDIGQPIIAQGDVVTVTMDEDLSSSWTAPSLTATDPTGDTLTWSLSSAASNGTATISGTGSSPTTFTYVPNADYNGLDSFVVQVADTEGFTDMITVQVTVTAYNDAPVFTSSAVTTHSSGTYAYTITVSDVEGDSISLTGATLPSGLTLNDNGDGTFILSGTLADTTGESHLGGATDLGQGWKYLDWFGYFYEDASGWISHTELGWVYTASKGDEFWFWTEMLGWVWTTPVSHHSVSLTASDGSDTSQQAFTIESGVFPNLYSHDFGVWVFYEKGTTPVQYYNHGTRQWVRSLYSHAVNVTIDDILGGTVTGAGTYEKGSSVTLTATTTPGYRFTGWSGDVTATDTSIQFTVSSDLNIQANFTKLDASDWGQEFF